jgi:hypothetical protein
MRTKHILICNSMTAFHIMHAYHPKTIQTQVLKTTLKYNPYGNLRLVALTCGIDAAIERQHSGTIVRH